MTKMRSMLLIKFLTLHSLIVLSTSQNPDFFYFILQWPPSYCSMLQNSCFGNEPPQGAFIIRGLRPARNNGSLLTNCNSSSDFDPIEILDLMTQLVEKWPPLSGPITEALTLWSHEWDKYGTCALPLLDPRNYFLVSIHSEAENDFVKALANADIKPDGKKYELASIKAAIKESSGFTPGIECDTAIWTDGPQLSRIYMCLNSSGSGFIECPVYPTEYCDSSVLFPSATSN